MSKLVDESRLQQSMEIIRDRLLIKDKTEAQALVQSANYPNCVYYTTDTHAIVVGGVVYSRSVEITNAFMYANSTQDQGSWNHDRLYIVPGDHAGEFNIWGYTSSNWYVVGTTSLNIATDAIDINYDATNSKLDADNVQDAIDEVVDVIDTNKLIAGDGISIEKIDPVVSPEFARRYKRLDYLQSNSSANAHIDTGIAAKDSLEIECEFYYSSHTNYAPIYSNYIDENANVIRTILSSSSGNIRLNHNVKASAASAKACALSTWHSIISNHTNYTLDGTTSSYTSSTQGTANTTNIALFGGKVGTTTDYNIGLKVRKFSIKDNGTLVCNLVPCKRRSDGELGMYCTVRKIFITNNGSGSFVAGDEIDDGEYGNVISTPWKEDVFGVNGRWADVIEEGMTYVSFQDYIIRASNTTNGNIGKSTTNYLVAIPCKAGDKFCVQGCRTTNGLYAWAFYDTWRADFSNNTAYTMHDNFISGNPDVGTTNDFAEQGIVAPTDAKMFIAHFYSAAHNIRDGFVVEKWVEDPVSIVDQKGRLIDSWGDDLLFPNDFTTEYNVGDTIGYWLVNRAYGSRGKRLPVKEGDKLLLDTFSPLRCGLYFTDEELVIVSKYEDRRYDGVYTAPCDGYAYIIDVLYRDNWIYEGAFANLAYVAYDAKKNTTFDKDYYNEFAPYSRMGVLPYEVYGKPVSNTAFFSLSNNTMTSRILHDDKYLVVAVHTVLGENNEQTSGSFNIGGTTNFTSTTTSGTSIKNVRSTTIQQLIGAGSKGAWTVQIYKNLDIVDSWYMIRLLHGNTMSTSKYLHLTVDKIYSHTFADINEANRVATAIGNDQYNISNQTGFIESAISPWMQAMGTTSALGLGYNIFDKGAELPMDNDGFAYGVTLKGIAGKTFGSSTEANADKSLVYLPVMDWSGYTGTKARAFMYCTNLITIPDVVWSSSLVISDQFFSFCKSLKNVGNLTPAKIHLYEAFDNCQALESIGDMETDTTPSFTRVFRACYNLKSIGTITFNGGVTACSNAFADCYVLEDFPSEIPLADNCTAMPSMFANCKNLTNSKVPTFTRGGVTANATANITAMNSMFYSCNKLTTTVSLDMTSVTTVSSMYESCANLLTAGDFYLPACTTASGIFKDCKKLTSVGDVYVPLATATSTMFQNNYRLASVGDITMTSANKNMSYMFYCCYDLTEIPEMDTSGVTNWTDCFRQCTSLRSIQSIDFSSITTPGSYLFYSDSVLELIEIKNLGKSSLTSYDLRSLSAWGSTTADGLTSLKNTFINLYDRASNGMSNATIRVAAAVYTRIQSNLSASEWASIAGKGYTLTNS